MAVVGMHSILFRKYGAQKQCPLTGELLLRFNIVLLDLFFNRTRRTTVLLGFSPLTISSLDSDVTASPLLPHDFWTLENVYVISRLLWDFLPGSSATVFCELLEDRECPLCISAPWPRTWPRGVLDSLYWIHINLCDDIGEEGCGKRTPGRRWGIGTHSALKVPAFK